MDRYKWNCAYKCGGCNIFLKTVDSKTDRHTAGYIFTVFDQVIRQIGPDKVTGICTDNTPVMKAFWELVQEKYPAITTYGCATHSFNLIAKDINKLPTFVKILAETKKIIHFFKNKHTPRQIFKKIQNEQHGKQIALSIPVETQ